MSRGHDSQSRPNNQPSRTGRSKAERNNRSRQLNPKDVRYEQSRGRGHSASRSKSGSSTPDWRSRMKSEDAARIQSHADRTGTNQDFKERSQRAAEKNEDS